MPTSNGGDGQRARRVEREPRLLELLRRLFLLDVVTDKASRPNILYAATTLLIGTVVYHRLEGWSYLDALYFCVITLATVGYGDFHPTTPQARLFTIVYVINGIGILLALFDRIRVVRQHGVKDELAAVAPTPPDDASEP